MIRTDGRFWGVPKAVSRCACHRSPKNGVIAARRGKSIRARVPRGEISTGRIEPNTVVTHLTMGLFYSNFTLRGPARHEVVEKLRTLKRTAFVSPTQNGFTTIYDRESDEQDFDLIERLGSALSESLNCPVLAAVLHDDDVLYYWLFRDGEVSHDYNSSPAYFDPDSEPLPPAGGDGHELCETFGCPSAENQVKHLLAQDLFSDEATIPGELERHEALAKMLGLPPCSVGVGYGTIEGGFLPDEFKDVKFTRVA
jgi:hypothetical protein